VKVLVTGASGFLGAQIVRALGAKKHHPIALLRESSSRARLPKGVEIRESSLDDEKALRQACEGVDALIHAAGGGRQSAGEDMRARNVALTQKVIEAAEDAELKSLIFISSLAAKSARSQYGRAKKEAETLVHASEALRTLVVRPSAIYGPFDDRWLSYFKGAQKRIALHPKVDSLRMIHVDDCADFIAHALEIFTNDNALDKHSFDICDGRTYTWKDVSNAVGQALDKRVYTLTLSSTMLNVVTDLSTFVARLRRRSAFLSRDKIADATTAHESESQRSHERFAWSPRYTLSAGMRHTLEGYRESGDL